MVLKKITATSHKKSKILIAKFLNKIAEDLVNKTKFLYRNLIKVNRKVTQDQIISSKVWQNLILLSEWINFLILKKITMKIEEKFNKNIP